jgi:hypothetical protein
VPAAVKNKKLLVALFLLWLSVTGWFAFDGDIAGSVISIAVGGLGVFAIRRREDDAELVEYFVTDRRIVVHTDEERDLKLRAINHAQRVFAHVQRARRSAEGTSAE